MEEVIFLSFSHSVFKKRKRTFPLFFYQVTETLVKVSEKSKKLWKHPPPPAAPVHTVFLVLPNFYSCFKTSIETCTENVFYSLKYSSNTNNKLYNRFES